MIYPDLDEAYLRDEITYADMIRIHIARDRAAGFYDHLAGQNPTRKRDYRDLLGPGVFPYAQGNQLDLFGEAVHP